MNKPAQKLFNNLWLSAIAVAASGKETTPSPADLRRLYDAISSIEDACIKDGIFKWKNAKGPK